MAIVLDFEKPIIELEDKIQELKSFTDKEDIDLSNEIEKLTKKIKALPDTSNNARLKALFCLLALQGLRQIEAVRLDVEDLDLVNGLAR